MEDFICGPGTTGYLICKQHDYYADTMIEECPRCNDEKELKRKITREEFEEIISQYESNNDYSGDRILRGIFILLNYFNSEKEHILQAAEHDQIFTVDVDELINRGLTKEHAILLKEIGWFIDQDCLSHFA